MQRRKTLTIPTTDLLRPNERHDFIERFANQGSPAAIKLKAKGLTDGLYGYARNPTEARIFIENLVAQDNEKAIELKAEGLVLGKYGYEGATEAEIEEFINALDPGHFVMK